MPTMSIPGANSGSYASDFGQLAAIFVDEQHEAPVLRRVVARDDPNMLLGGCAPLSISRASSSITGGHEDISEK